MSKREFDPIRLSVRIAAALFVVLIGLIVSSNCYSTDNAIEHSDIEWRKIFTYGPLSNEPVKWCGQASLVAKAWDMTAQTGGIVYIDVASKKTLWLTHFPFAKDPFCNFDGSLVFYYKMSKDGLRGDGLWEYNLKTRKTRRVGNASTEYFSNPASPNGNIYALVAGKREVVPSFR